MKNILITFILTLFVVAGFAQQTIPNPNQLSSDDYKRWQIDSLRSVIVSVTDSTFSRQNTVYYTQDGVSKFVTASAEIVDTTTLESLYFNNALDLTRQYASNVASVLDGDELVADLIEINSALQSSTGTGLLQLSVDEFGQDFIGSWTVRLNGATPTGTMAINGNTLELTVGASTYTLWLVGDSMIRIKNYTSTNHPTPVDIDLFRDTEESSIFFSAVNTDTREGTVDVIQLIKQ